MKLPAFKTEKEEIRFRKKHSIADYWKDLKDSNDDTQKPSNEPGQGQHKQCAPSRCSPTQAGEKCGFRNGNW